MDLDLNNPNMIVFLVIVCLGIYLYISPTTSTKKQAFSIDIEKATIENENYRQVLYTTNNLQLVLMSLLPGEEIGFETHPKTSQFFRIEKGKGLIVSNGNKYPVKDGHAVVFPPNSYHNVINTSNIPGERLQIYTIYTPPEHPANRLEKQKPK